MKIQTEMQFSNIMKNLKQELKNTRTFTNQLATSKSKQYKDVATKISIEMIIFGYFMCFVPFD